MRTCSNCNAQSPDSALYCVQCNAELSVSSSEGIALKKFQANPRVKYIRIVSSHDSCPACLEIAGAYEKGGAPALPVEACSHQHGCRCFYLPFLTDIYP